MEHFRVIAMVLVLVSPVSAAQQTAAPELTSVDIPSIQSARELAVKESAARPLFEVMQGNGRHLISIQKGQLDVPFLLSATVSKGLGEVVHSGDPSDSFLFSFRRVEDTILMVRLNTGFRAAPGSPEAAGVKAAYPDVPLASVKIAMENVESGYVVVSADELFLADLSDIRQSVADGFELPSSALAPIKELTRLEKVAALHSNVEADVSFAFAPQTPVRSRTLPDTRVLPVSVRYSISAPPAAEGFDVRAADPRVGYFTTKYRDYSASGLKDRLDPLRQLAERWRLEKEVPSAEISDVKKPIVWWVDEATPTQYRDAVKAGILAWNEAFEAIGLRHAIVVKEVDKDMSPEERAHFNPADASYNIVRWFMDPSAGYAFGPSRANPMTGEIYNATVMMSDQMSRLWDIAMKPELASAIDEDVRPDPAQLAALQAQGITPAEKELVTQQYLTHVVMHEIGHTLGLRHNFKGSQLQGLDDMGKDGLVTASVMDYMPMNVPDPNQPKVYYQTKIGPYDRWAIEYGYKPLSADPALKSAALKEIARRSDADPKLAFGTDEDVRGIDPDVRRFDFSREPVRYADVLVDRAERLWSRSATAAIPESVPPAAAALSGGINLYYGSVSSVLPLIGGVRSDRRPTDEGGARLRPVPAAEQRAALDFLTRRIFAAKAFAVPSELALHATVDPLEASAGRGLPDVPEAALSVQRGALDHLYDPATLRRLTSDEQIEPAKALKVSELFKTVKRSIWTELDGKGRVDVTLLRRQLQRAHVEELSALAKNPDASADAVALARADLASIARDARRAQARAADPAIKAHLVEIVRLAGSLDDSEPDVAKR
jgi:hypothetical protein